MTDTEIIKAKKIIHSLHAYCFLTQPTYKQMGCDFCENDFDILNKFIDDNNRQRATIERQVEAIQAGYKLAQELKAEIERLNIKNKILTDITKNYDWKFEKVKSESIKEVFEKLNDKSIVCKVKLYGKGKFYPCLSAVTLHDINKLKKEMTEGL